jgi:hypothetical protein
MPSAGRPPLFPARASSSSASPPAAPSGAFAKASFAAVPALAKLVASAPPSAPARAKPLFFSSADFEDTLPTPANTLADDLLRALPASGPPSSSLVSDFEAPKAALPPVKVRVSAIEEFALKTHAKTLRENEPSGSKKKKQQVNDKNQRRRGNQRFSPF